MKLKKSIPTKSQLHNYAAYSGIAIQMGIIIFLGIWGGTKLDEFQWVKFPLFTVLFSVISVPLAIYIAIKDFIKKK